MITHMHTHTLYTHTFTVYTRVFNTTRTHTQIPHYETKPHMKSHLTRLSCRPHPTYVHGHTSITKCIHILPHPNSRKQNSTTILHFLLALKPVSYSYTLTHINVPTTMLKRISNVFRKVSKTEMRSTIMSFIYL